MKRFARVVSVLVGLAACGDPESTQGPGPGPGPAPGDTQGGGDAGPGDSMGGDSLSGDQDVGDSAGGDANGGDASGGDGISTDTTPPTLAASPLPGTYPEAQSVTLSADEAATIYYTVDGSTPTTASASADSLVVLPIGASTTVRAFAIDRANNTSNAQTFAYVIDLVPELTLHSPLAGATDVPQWSNVTLHFDRAMDRSSVETATLVTAGSTPVSVAWHWYAEGDAEVAVLWPTVLGDDVPFDPATSYSVTLGSAAESLLGEPLGVETTFVFTTNDDTDPGFSVSPIEGAVLPSSASTFSVTFSRPMDVSAGEVVAQISPNEEGGDFWIDLGPLLSWDGTGQTLTFVTPGPIPADARFAVLRFQGLRRADGARVPDVEAAYVLDRPGHLGPVQIDRPFADEIVDPSLPLFWLSKTVSPGADAEIYVTEAGETVALGSTTLGIFGRALSLPTGSLSVGDFELHVPSAVLDAEGNPAAATTLPFSIGAPAEFAPYVVGLADGAIDLPRRDFSVWVAVPADFDPSSLVTTAARLSDDATGTPVRGLRVRAASRHELRSLLRVDFDPGTPTLAAGTSYTLELEGAEGLGGRDLFAAGPLSFTFTTTNDDETLPLLDPERSEVSLDNSGTLQRLSASVMVHSDLDVVVSLVGLDGDLDVTLVESGQQPGRYVLEDFDAEVATSSLVPGWNVIDVLVDDGTRVVSMPADVYFVTGAEIPQITEPQDGAVLTAAEIPNMVVEWTAEPAATALSVLSLYADDGFGRVLVDQRFVSAEAVDFPLGVAYADRLLPGSSYEVTVRPIRFSSDLHAAGSAALLGENRVTFAVQDENLGSISGTLTTTTSVVGSLRVVVVEESFTSMRTATATLIAPNTYSYNAVNIPEGSYIVVAILDGLANDTADFETWSGPDNLLVPYGAVMDPEPDVVVLTTGDLDHTGIDIPLDNPPGRLDVTVQSNLPIDGNLQIEACPTSVSSGDPECRYATIYGNGNSGLEVEVWYLAAADYDVYASADFAGGGPTVTVSTSVTPSPATVTISPVPVEVILTAPLGGIDIAVTSNRAIQGSAFVMVCDEGALDISDPSCFPGSGVNFLGSTVGTFNLRLLDDGTYRMWVIADFDDDSYAEWSFPALVSPDPVVIAGAVVEATAAFVVPGGTIALTSTSDHPTTELYLALCPSTATDATDPACEGLPVVPGDDELVVQVNILFVPDGDYILFVWGDFDGDGLPENDFIQAATPTPLTVAASVTNASVNFDLPEGRVLVDLTASDSVVAVYYSLCTPSVCGPFYYHDPDSPMTDSFVFGFVSPGDYTAIATPDVDGDGQPEYLLATEATPDPLSVSSGDVNASVNLSIPSAQISGVVTYGSVPAYGAVSISSGVADTYAEVTFDGSDWVYVASFIPDGTYALTLWVDSDGDQTFDGSGTPAGTQVVVSGGVSMVQNFAYP